ncbi:MAG: hypothetical protein Q8K64_06730 [Sediminibacterium sp.]|nr:hypothetical protein [Sediminibacterium sp.]
MKLFLTCISILCFTSCYSQNNFEGIRLDTNFVFKTIDNKSIKIGNPGLNSFHVLFFCKSFNSISIDSIVRLKSLGKAVDIIIISENNNIIGIKDLEKFNILSLIDVNAYGKAFFKFKKLPSFIILGNDYRILKFSDSVDDVIVNFNKYYFNYNNIMKK